MKTTNRILVSGLMLGCCLGVAAVPAKRDVRTVKQPDGTTLRIKKVGDEHRHFLLTEDDMLLTNAPDGTYCYAYINDSGFIESTGVAATDLSVRANVPYRAARLADIDERKLASARKRIPQTGMGLDKPFVVGKGSPHVLILLVEYADVKFTHPDPQTYFNGMLNEEGFSQYGGTGSCKDYFTENSNGQFTPHFDLYGPVTLPKKRAYYGSNDRYGDDMHPEEMVIDAIKVLDAEVDFSIYDNDGDGVLDNVYVIYAGQGEASYGSTDTVWPHSWDLSAADRAFDVDGVTVDHYACSNEWEESRPDGIGTFVHEFSHVLGLPDLYNTVSMASYTPDRYSVLDYGPYNNNGCTPPAYSIFERNAMGWIEPEVISGPMDGELKHILASNAGYIIPTERENEYFLLENRQQEGWDKYIPGHGMLIWHIDFNRTYWSSNTVNNTPTHQYVDIEEACGYTTKDISAEAGYTFPGTAGVTSFTDDTTPSMRTWNNKPLELPLTEITETDGIIRFLVAGGYDPIGLAVPVPIEASRIEKSDKHFVAAWEPVENAIDYEVSVYAAGIGSPQSAACDMGSDRSLSLASGWTSNSEESYNTTSNYGEASPSLKLAKDEAYLLSPEFDSAVLSVSYWRKGMNTDGSTLTIYGLTAGKWETIHTETPKANVAETVMLDNIPAGVTQVKFVYSKSKGNLALDDVIITAGAGDMPLADYVDRSTSGATSLRIDKLAEGCNTYKFKVRAVGERRPSAYSDLVTVELPLSGIDNVEAIENGDDVRYYDMFGRRVVNPEPGQILIRRRGLIATKVLVK